MSRPEFQSALILTGPTGSGKSRLALELAEQLNAEIVCMDSMTLYRGMDIGTAKPTMMERARVPHHLLDVLDPWESASVAWWLDEAAKCCHDIRSRGRVPLLVGGTPLYLKALLHGLFDGPPADPELRRRLEADAQANGPAALHARLAVVDPVSAGRLHPNDVRRLVRALEVYELTGRPISAWQTQWRAADAASSWTEAEPLPRCASEGSSGPSRALRANERDSRCVWIDLPRALLYDRINRRVEEMVAAGFVEEVRRLRNLPRPLSREAGRAAGYAEMLDYIEGRVELSDTIVRIQQRTRNLAKRQLAWLRRLPDCVALSAQLTFSAWGITIQATP